MFSNNTIERLFIYRRILLDLLQEKKTSVFSHQLAAISGASSEQVRRDLMGIGADGHKRHGYDVEYLLKQLNLFFKTDSGINIVLVGVGNLGRAFLSYFSGKRPNIFIKACFDNDKDKTNRIINGCRCFPIEELTSVVKDLYIQVGIIAVPANIAQEIAEKFISAGIICILNTTPVRLRVPDSVMVENLDVTLSIEKLGFFAKKQGA